MVLILPRVFTQGEHEAIEGPKSPWRKSGSRLGQNPIRKVKKMSTTQKSSIKGLKIGEDQFELLGETVKELVGEAGTVTIKDKDGEGLLIKSRHHVAANSKYADIRIRFHGANSDVGIYVDEGGQIKMAWDGYVVRAAGLKNTFEGRTDRNTFEKNLNGMVVAKTFEETAIRKGFSSSGIKRVSLKEEKRGQFELELDTGGFGMSSFGSNEKKNTLSGSLGGGL